MTPARLQSFLAIVDSGSARAAASQLHVTESAVSASLAALQQEIGVALFQRQGRGLRLTDSGAVFATYARRILGLLDESVAAARGEQDAETGQLRLGSVPTAGEYLVPGLLASFRDAHPGVEITVEIGARDRIVSRLSDHQLDIVLGGRPPAGRELVSRASRSNNLIVVASPRLAVTLAEATWLLREPGSGTRATTERLLDSLGIEPPVLTLGSHGAVIASAVLGLGPTLASADAVGRLLAQGELEQRATAGTPMSRPWHLLTSPQPTATATLFVQHATRHVGPELAFSSRRQRRLTG